MRDKYSASIFKLVLTVGLMQVKMGGNYEMKQHLDLGNCRSVLGSCHVSVQKSGTSISIQILFYNLPSLSVSGNLGVKFDNIFRETDSEIIQIIKYCLVL